MLTSHSETETEQQLWRYLPEPGCKHHGDCAVDWSKGHTPHWIRRASIIPWPLASLFCFPSFVSLYCFSSIGDMVLMNGICLRKLWACLFLPTLNRVSEEVKRDVFTRLVPPSPPPLSTLSASGKSCRAEFYTLIVYSPPTQLPWISNWTDLRWSNWWR
jgi:hypothetical protein